MTGLTETPQPSGRQKPLAEWIAELGGGPVSWGRAADELIAGRYRSWWFNYVTGEWNEIVQQYWLSPDPSDHRMAGLSVHERAWLRMNDATLGWGRQVRGVRRGDAALARRGPYGASSRWPKLLTSSALDALTRQGVDM